MPAQPSSAWKRLGELLEQRRVQMNPQYANLSRFAADREINYRLAWDVEHGERTNYRRPTLRAIEVAYGLMPGAIDMALAGGDLSARQDGQVPPIHPEDFPEGPLRDIAALPALSDRVKWDLIAIARRNLAENGTEHKSALSG